MSIFSRMCLIGMVNSAVTMALIWVAGHKTLAGLAGYVIFNLWQISANVAAEIVKTIKETRQ